MLILTSEDLLLIRRQLTQLEETVEHYTTHPRAIDKHGTCVYRNEQGHTCAIGRHIPSYLYDPSWEGKVVNEEIMAELPLEIAALGLGFLSTLQDLHDRDSHWTCFEELELSCTLTYNGKQFYNWFEERIQAGTYLPINFYSPNCHESPF